MTPFQIFLWALTCWGGNAILFYTLGEHIYHGTKKRVFWCLVVLGNAIISSVLACFIPSPYLLPALIVVAMAFEIPPYLFTTRGSWGKRMFLTLNIVCCAAIIGVPAIWLSLPFLGVTSVAKVIICTVLAWVYHRYVHTSFEQTVSSFNRHWFWINAACVLFSAPLYYFIVLCQRGLLAFYVLFITLALSSVAYMSILYILYSLTLSTRLAEEKLQEELLLRQLQSLLDAEEQARVMRHDLRHHNLTLAAFAQQGQIVQLLHYLEDYDQSIIADTRPKYCEHQLANNVIAVYAQLAQRAGVAFVPHPIALRANCPIAQRDLMGLLSNLLENALHCAQQEQQGQITLSLFEKGDKLVVLCQNTATAPVRFQDGIPQATHRKSSGIASVLRTVARYDGMVDFSQQKGEFTAHIILNV